MAKLKDFITELARKSGADLNAPAMQTFLGSATMPDFEIPGDVETALNTGLISITDAKNNHQEIKNHYTRQALNSIDSTIQRIMDESGFDDQFKGDVLADKSSYRRIELLAQKIKDFEGKKVNAGGGNKDIQKQIDELQLQIRNEKEIAKKTKEAHDKELMKFRVAAAIDTMLARTETVYDDPAIKIAPEVRATTLHAIIENELAQKKAKFVFDENGLFSLQKDDGTNFYGEGNTQVFPKQFIEKALAQSNVLKVNKTPDTPAGTPVPPKSIDGKTNKPNAAFAALAAETMNDIKKAGTAMPLMNGQ